MYFPIIYIRGFAATPGEIEAAVADPYMGFNQGSAKIRQRLTGDVEQYFFESPLLRLFKEHGYTDAFFDGEMQSTVPPKSIWIYRYYDACSFDFGNSTRGTIPSYAKGLKTLIDRVLMATQSSKVYLVAHSMGGLIARCFLQTVEPNCTRVDKVFTYGTPHRGIAFRLVGSLPTLTPVSGIKRFHPKNIKKDLKIPADREPHSLADKFDPERFFCCIGTDARDYGTFHGLIKGVVGPMSDGLVLLENAYVATAPRAYVHRSHSGPYGLVNSEAGYQNLQRFLFGRWRVDVKLQVESLFYPPGSGFEKHEDRVEAGYHIEFVARVAGARWDLQRRVTNDHSSKFATQRRMLLSKERPIYLGNMFLFQRELNDSKQSTRFCADIGVMVPDYKVRTRFLQHRFEGGYLYRDKLNFELSESELYYGMDSESPNQSPHKAGQVRGEERISRFSIPLVQQTLPGLNARLLLDVSPWNVQPEYPEKG